MPELRIALTVLPVGPRGVEVVAEMKPLWFALQISAGFAEEESPAKIDGLWPWVLHVVKTGKVALNAWVDGTTAIPLEADVEVDDFAKRLRAAIEKTYAGEEARKDLDLRLLIEGDAGRDDPDHHRRSFPARVQYLATLPGEMSSRLLATVYVKIDVAHLFVQNGNAWEPKGNGNLFIAPKAVMRSAEIPLNGPPAKVTGTTNLLSVTGNDSGLTIRALGPGFALARFLAPEKSMFDLETYKAPVTSGVRRYVEMESLLASILDPFGELDHLRSRAPREGVEIVNVKTGVGRTVAEETFETLVELWRVVAFAKELGKAIPTALHELARLLLPTGETMPALTIPDRWGADLAADVAEPDLLVLAKRMAARLSIASADDATTLRRVAERSGVAAIAALAAQAFDETLTATSAAESLRQAWRFGDPKTPVELAERRRALALAAVDELREQRVAPPVLASLAGKKLPADARTALRDALKAQLEPEWAARKEPRVATALAKLGLAEPDETQLDFLGDFVKEQAKEHLETVWPDADADARPELPGRGLPLVVGAKTQRLVHEDNEAANGDQSPYREVAGVLLLARRGIDAGDLENRAWHVVTSGTAFVGDLKNRLFAPDEVTDEEYLKTLLPLPLRPVFQQKVARADLEYHGQPMLAQSALDSAYEVEDVAADGIAAFASAYSFQPLGNFEGKVGAAAAGAGRAPVLRYGDFYEFRGRVVDQAGGLARDVADKASPWKLDLTLPLEPKTPSNVIAYLRAVPPGEVNVLPGTGADPNVREHWPALPDDVALRAREWWGLTHDGGDNLPALLFSASKLAGTLPGYDFRILPPVIDEHTLIRWAVPAIGAGDRDAVLARLKRALAELLQAREKERALPLHDPAVAMLGIRVRGAAKDNRIVDVFTETIPIPEGDLPYQRKAIAVKVTATAEGTPAVSHAAGVLSIAIPETSFATLEVFPLVADSDFTRRFAAFDGLTDDSTPFPGHVAFHPSVVLLEGATALMPKEEQLYAGLTLAEQQDGAIAVRFEVKETIEELVFVDRFAIERERWVWRNLPIIAGKLPQDAGERRRLAASGPPAEVFDPNKRDTSEEVADWERLAGLDRGFADRGETGGRWPRVAPVAPSAGGPGASVLLLLDDRDAVTSADYLRFGLRTRSRYAGVLPKKERVETSASAPTRRRIVCGFRGSKVKPPKILGVVPLTATIERDPVPSTPGVSPFLILLDETFFREYGVGERLEIHLALENLDLHEDPKDVKLPYRTGPLPDHWLPRKESGEARYFGGKKVTVAGDAAAPVALDVFGPFGYSLDITPSEALANASAFVAHPPPKQGEHLVGPHWAMFARMRRVLDRPSNGALSEWSDTHALYTLPDARLLAQKLTDGAALELEDPKSEGKATLRGLRFILDATATPRVANDDPLRNSEAAGQYRYFVLVSTVVPGAGQGFEAELPLGLWRIRLFDPNANGNPAPDAFPVEFRPGEKTAAITVAPLKNGSAEPGLAAGVEYRGRVLEVLINGRYERESRLDTITEWKAFWEALLDRSADGECDAAGMIRRVSEAFRVEVSSNQTTA